MARMSGSSEPRATSQEMTNRVADGIDDWRNHRDDPEMRETEAHEFARDLRRRGMQQRVHGFAEPLPGVRIRPPKK